MIISPIIADCIRCFNSEGAVSNNLHDNDPRLQSVEADVRDEQSVVAAIAGVDAVVNAVSLYVERGEETFHSVHVASARRVAVQAQRVGIRQLVHVSGIGSDPRSRSLYIRKRGEGELAVQAAFTNAIVIRPAVMFGPDDAFLTTILKLLKRLPIYPMFGSGLTRLQPAYVEDVAEAIVRAIQRTETNTVTYECGGPAYLRELLRLSLGSRVEAHPHSCSICRLAGIGLDCGDDAKSTYHSQSSGTDASQQCALV